MGKENAKIHEELAKMDELIQAATDVTALRPIFARVHEVLQSYTGDFDVQLNANEVKQRLMARAAVLKAPSGILLPTDPSAVGIQGGASAGGPARTKDPSKAPVTADKRADSKAPGTTSTSGILPARRPAKAWNRMVVIVPAVAVLVAAACVGYAIHESRTPPPSQVEITTTPPGASVEVQADPAAPGSPNVAVCKSNCKVPLKAGRYRVSAFMDGYESATASISVAVRQPANVALSLMPQPQSVRLLTNLSQGKVVVDDQPPVPLQEGQFVLDRATPGTHTVKVTGGPTEEASFSFELADARLPSVTGPVTAKSMVAVLVSTFAKQARIATNAGPWKLMVNGQAQSDAVPAGIDLTGFHPGVNEIIVGEGKDQRSMSESFGTAPMLTAFLSSDINEGTLIVSAGQEDVQVFLNDKKYQRNTHDGGLLRIPRTPGKVTVRVAKAGFLDEAPQTVEVKKGAQVRVEFELKPQPQFASLQIRGAAAGTEVVLDNKSAGVVEQDGSFTLGAIQPGDHNIDLRRDQYIPKRLTRSFRASQVTVLAAADVVLAAARGAVHITKTPENATVNYRCGTDTETHEARAAQLDLAPANCSFTATAPGYVESTKSVQVTVGATLEVPFVLNKVPVVTAPPPPPMPKGMTEFEDVAGWKQDGDTWVHKGGGFIGYKLPPKGVFNFTVELLKGGGVLRILQGSKIRLCAGYVDDKNYLLYEVDTKGFWAGVIEKGKRYERLKSPLNLPPTQKAMTFQVEIMPDRMVTKLLIGNEWKVLDAFTEPNRDFTQGKFGFRIEGKEELAISAFKFVPAK